MLYMKIKSFSPFRQMFAYVDSEEHYADQIFIKNEIPVKFKGDFTRKGQEARIIICSVRKRDIKKFEKSMEQLEKKFYISHKHDAYVEMWRLVEESGRK